MSKIDRDGFDGDERPLTDLGKVNAGIVRLPLDRQGRISTDSPRYATALFRVTANQSQPILSLIRIEKSDSRKFEVRFEGGPLEGVRQLDFPAQFGPAHIHTLADELGAVAGPDDSAVKLAVYRRGIQGTQVAYEFEKYIEDDAALESAKLLEKKRMAIRAMNRFYSNPDYSVYSIQPTGDHEQVEIQLHHRRASVDKGIAQVILGMWRLGFDTLGSCERRKSGKAYVSLPVPGHAEECHKILQSKNICSELRLKDKTMKVNNAGKNYTIQGGHVLFDALDTERVIEALSQAFESLQQRIIGSGTLIVSPSASELGSCDLDSFSSNDSKSGSEPG
jgi:hypothetical protein